MSFDPTTVMWLNRIGMLMGFLAFWLGAPEILGETRLSKLEAGIEGVFRQLEQGIGVLARYLSTDRILIDEDEDHGGVVRFWLYCPDC